MRQLGLDLVSDMRAHGATGARVGADRLEREVTAWWKLLGAPDIQAGKP